MSNFVEETLKEWGLSQYIEKFKGYHIFFNINFIITKG